MNPNFNLGPGSVLGDHELPQLPLLPFDSKEEKLQVKTAISFAFMKTVGHLVRIHMRDDYRRNGAPY